MKKTMKKIISILLATLFVISIAASTMVFATTSEQTVTPTEGWGADPDDGIYYIDDAADFLAFRAAASYGSASEQAKFILTADLDLTGVAAITTAMGDFYGHFDGQGHEIKGLTIASADGIFGDIRANSVIEDLRITEANVSATGSGVGILSSTFAGTNILVQNVYIDGTVSGAGNVGGFTGIIMATGRTVTVKNCVSACTVKATLNGAGGFLGNIYNGNDITFEDCVFTGDLTGATNVVGGIVGMTTGNVTMRRCVSLGNFDTTKYQASLMFIDHQNRLYTSSTSTVNGTSDIVIEDCYATHASPNFGVGISNGRGFCFNLTVKYGGETVFSHSDAEVYEEDGTLTIANGLYSQKDEIDTKVKYIGATLTADTFAELCSNLFLNGWVMTTENVIYGTNSETEQPLTVPEIMPSTMATALGRTPVEVPAYEWAEELRDGVTAYYIDDAADFLAFRAAASYGSASDYKKFILTADLDLTGVAAITTAMGDFYGHFDGQGHEIKGLTITHVSGIFGTIRDSSTIKDLRIVNGTFGAAGSNGVGVLGNYAAGNAIVIENVYVNANVYGAQKVGGFIAELAGSGRDVTIRNCVSDCTVYATSNGGGGFIGHINSQASGVNIARFEDCVFTGDVSVAATRSAGFVGWLRGSASFERCAVLGKVKDATDETVRSGAFVVTDHNDQYNSVTDESLWPTVAFTDCYASVGARYGFGVGGYPNYFTVSIGYTGQETKTWEITSDTDENITSFRNEEKYIGATLTADNFETLCPNLFLNGWVMTTENVTYGTDLTVPEILPSAEIAKALGRTTVGSPVSVEYWHGAKDVEDSDYDVRFIGTLSVADASKYDKVGVKLTIKEVGGNTLLDGKTYETANVFKSFKLGDELKEAAEGDYLYAVNMTGFKADTTYEITFEGYIVSGDTTITDFAGATTITVLNGEIVTA